MRRTQMFLTGALLLLTFGATHALAQGAHTSGNDEYELELPSQTWKATPRSENAQHLEFIYGERSDGYLRVRKEVVEASATLNEVARREADLKLRYLPGFVGGKDERFAGRLSGLTVSYEFTSAGKPMAGRIYYLQADNRTIYTLHFTARAEKLQLIRNQTDSIARSFRLK